MPSHLPSGSGCSNERQRSRALVRLVDSEMSTPPLVEEQLKSTSLLIHLIVYLLNDLLDGPGHLAEGHMYQHYPKCFNSPSGSQRRCDYQGGSTEPGISIRLNK